MKIKSLVLENYKKFNKKTINFCDEQGVPQDMVLIVGNNGTGKSSVLQAIGMLLNSAVQPFTRPSSFEYPGFNWGNIQRGRFPVQVRANIQFTPEEITATQEYSKRLKSLFLDRDYPKPGVKKEIEVFLNYADDEVRCKKLEDKLQLKGYEYALQLTKFERDFDQLFQRVGSLYAYHEQRTSISVNLKEENGFNGNGESHPSLLNEKNLKDILFKWYIFHQNKDKFEVREEQRRDFFSELESKYTSLFRGRTFKGFAPKMRFDDMLNPDQDFWLYDGRFDYEFSEMSAGERAIFPIIFDFARRKINNSIIIIDEIELHLHPPLQQALIGALPEWGSGNQFIITTHSDDVATLFSESQIIRLKDE